MSPRQRPTPEQLAAFADGELTEAAHDEVRAWLADHPEDRAEVESLRRVVRLCRESSPPEPTPEAWALALARIESALPLGSVTASRADGHGLRLRRASRSVLVLGALVAAAAVLGGIFVARWAWQPAKPQETPVVVQTGPNGAAEDDELDGPFPVASAADVYIISMDARDADAIAMGQPILGTFEVVAPREIEVHEVGQGTGGSTPRLEEGAVPMIVSILGGRRAP